jgi:hypothetical protein
MKIGTWCSGGDATEIQSQPVPLSTIRCFVTFTVPSKSMGVSTNQPMSIRRCHAAVHCQHCQHCQWATAVPLRSV